MNERRCDKYPPMLSLAEPTAAALLTIGENQLKVIDVGKDYRKFRDRHQHVIAQPYP